MNMYLLEEKLKYIISIIIGFIIIVTIFTTLIITSFIIFWQALFDPNMLTIIIIMIIASYGFSIIFNDYILKKYIDQQVDHKFLTIIITFCWIGWACQYQAFAHRCMVEASVISIDFYGGFDDFIINKSAYGNNILVGRKPPVIDRNKCYYDDSLVELAGLKNTNHTDSKLLFWPGKISDTFYLRCIPAYISFYGEIPDYKCEIVCVFR